MLNKIENLNLHLKNPLVFFDLETTGINISKDRIVELSFLKVKPNGEQTTYTQKINPQMPIPLPSSVIHGIYDEDVKDAPSFKMVAKNLANMLEGCDLAGFNVIRFDVPMLVEEFLRAEVEFDIGSRKIVDAQRIFHMMEPRDLGAAYRFYCNDTFENAHSAEADTWATFHVLNAQVAYYKDRELIDKNGNKTIPIQNDMKALHDLTSSQMVDLAGHIVISKEGAIVFNFGKHKNVPVLDVLKREPSYYDWMMKGDFPLNTKQKLTEIRLSAFNQKNK
ncbi:MAG: 3'-5' exonuclease [Bacteroidetes bacterium]|nr:MAG: 3'-5' exonuclease [Bacteroidota bacterium]